MQARAGGRVGRWRPVAFPIAGKRFAAALAVAVAAMSGAGHRR